jgi:hypothetical protein
MLCHLCCVVLCPAPELIYLIMLSCYYAYFDDHGTLHLISKLLCMMIWIPLFASEFSMILM